MIDIPILLLFFVYETIVILAGLAVMLFVPLQSAVNAISVVKCICRGICRGIAVGFALLWEFVPCILVTGFFARSSLGVSVLVIGCGLIVACVGVPDEIDGQFYAIPEWRQDMEKYQETFYDYLIPMGDEDDDDTYSGTSVYDEIMRYERLERLRKEALVLHEVNEDDGSIEIENENDDNDNNSLCYSIDSELEWDGSILYGESIDDDDDDDDDDGTQMVVVLDFHDDEEVEQVIPTPSTIPDLAQDITVPSPRRSPRLAALAEARTQEQRLVAELQRAQKALGSTVIGGRRRSARVFQATFVPLDR